MESELVKNVKRTRISPRKDSDINTLGTLTSDTWMLRPEYTLLWITPAQHKTNVTNYAAALNLRKSTGGGRAELSQELVNLDVKMDEGISRIKNFLVYKYQKVLAQSFFPQYGIVHKGNSYIFPKDRDLRKAALPLIVAAITAHGFTDAEYGLAFWQAAKQTYETLLNQASVVDGTVSKKVSNKNELRITIVKTHNSLIKLLQANHPDTYKSVIREWGFQKEKY